MQFGIFDETPALKPHIGGAAIIVGDGADTFLDQQRGLFVANQEA
jgi:hypothetical protein